MKTDTCIYPLNSPHPFNPLSAPQYERSPREDDEEWYHKVQTDAVESIRKLYSDRDYDQAIQQLRTCAFEDMPDPVAIAVNLLTAIETCGRGIEVFRQCIYAIVKKYISELPTPEIQTLISKIEHSIEGTQDIENTVELEICHAILKLIPWDPEILKRVRGEMHVAVAHTASARMVLNILAIYKNQQVYFKQRWFPVIMNVEGLFESAKVKPKTLIQWKRHIYEHHNDDWRVMCIAFRRIKEIIDEGGSEDLRDSAYWVGMAGGKSIKIAEFADPTPILSQQVFSLPLLCWRARFVAVKFLISLTSHADEAIVQDAAKKLEKYGQIEKDERITVLYKKYKAHRECTTQVISSHSAPPANHLDRFIKHISCLAPTPIPVEIIQEMLKALELEVDLNTYVQMPPDASFCKVKQTLSNPFSGIDQAAKIACQREVLLCLDKFFLFNPRKIKTWQRTRMLIVHIEHILNNLSSDLDEKLISIIEKLREFYSHTLTDQDKLTLYTSLCCKYAAALERNKRLSWRSPDPIWSMATSDHGVFFKGWQESIGLEEIKITNYGYDDHGFNQFSVQVKRLSGEVISIRGSRKNKKVNIEFESGSCDTYKEVLEKINHNNRLYMFSQVRESMKTIAQRNHVEEQDVFIIIDFFENILFDSHNQHESIVLSIIYFLSMFELTLHNKQWGIPTFDELNKIIDMKLCMSYLYHVYDRGRAEETYRNYNNRAIDDGGLALLANPSSIPHLGEYPPLVAVFYNTAVTSTEAVVCQQILSAYDAVLNCIDNLNGSNNLLYNCSIALQKVLTQNDSHISISVRRAACYLFKMQRDLSKKELLDLRYLIKLIIRHTDVSLESNSFNHCTRFLQSLSTIMPPLYTKIIKNNASENISDIVCAINDVVEYASKSKYAKSSISFIKAFCDLYVWTSYMQVPLESVKKLLNQRLGHISDNMFIPLITTFMKTASNFYLLHGEFSPLLLRRVSYLLDIVLTQYRNDADFVFRLTYNLFPLSLILWSSPLHNQFLSTVELLYTHCKERYKRESLKTLVNTLGLMNLVIDNIKILNKSKRIDNLQTKLNDFYKKAISDFIEFYLVPAWNQSQEDTHSKSVQIFIEALNPSVREDLVFLHHLEEAYQKFIFSNTQNPITIESIFSEINERFKHPPMHVKLPCERIPTYNEDGTLFEQREGYDILGVMLGIRSGMPYVRLGNRNFLRNLVSPMHQGEKVYITGFGAGGKMKVKLNVHGIPENGLLPLIEQKDLTSGKIGKFLEIISSREAYYYWQRMFNPLSQDGDIITGTFRVMYADDASVSFGEITNADGCGFIKESVLGYLGRKIANRTPYSLRTPIQTYQAIHHNKKHIAPDLFNKAVSECARVGRATIEKYLSANKSDQASVKELFSTLTTGGIKVGRNFVAIPATGEMKVIVPLSLKHADLWLGKTPYEKFANVLLKQEHEVAHLKSDCDHKKSAAQQVANLSGFQYSLLGVDGDACVFHKGIFLIIPDTSWPYPYADVICCTKDAKVDSRWHEGKEAPRSGSVKTFSGILTPVQLFGPGSFMALSTDIQGKRWDADYDGDIVTVDQKHKNTEIFSLMMKNLNHYTPYTTPKIPKTFTPARTADDTFSVFKFSAIMQARASNLMTAYAKNYDVFVALKIEFQNEIANTIANMACTPYLIQNILVDETEANIIEGLRTQPVLMIQKVLSAGVKTGADSFKSRVDWTYFKEFGNILKNIYTNMGIPNELVYFKSLCIEMHTSKTDFTRILAEAKYQIRFFDSLPLYILNETLSSVPTYKQQRLSQLLQRQIELDPLAQQRISCAEAGAKKNRRDKKFYRSGERVPSKALQPPALSYRKYRAPPGAKQQPVLVKPPAAQQVVPLTKINPDRSSQLESKAMMDSLANVINVMSQQLKKPASVLRRLLHK